MANLSRRNTFQDLFDFRRDFDRFFGNWPEREERSFFEQGFTPPVEVCTDRERNNYCVRVALPGIEPQEVNLEVHGNTLAISGERKFEDERNENEYLQREFSYGRFERLITLPEGVDTDRVRADFNNGMLEITAPISEAARPRRIQVGTGGERKTLSGESARAASAGAGSAGETGRRTSPGGRP